jgi:hypothetical protein
MIDLIHERVLKGEYRFSIHALERCAERNISPEEVMHAINTGTVIEDYPKDKYGRSCLIRGFTKEGEIRHVQCSVDPVWIITAYDPSINPEEWDGEFKRRKIKS